MLHQIRGAKDMLIYRQIPLSRDVEATEIPAGTQARLAAGTPVLLMQAQGGFFTVMTDEGRSYRLGGEDADAIGEARATPAAAAAPAPAGPGGEASEQAIWGELRTVFDPEIPVNIVDLGLIYLMRATPLPAGGSRVEVRMTLTAPGCGMGQVLKSDVERKLGNVLGVKEVAVDLVWDPPWDRSRMSEAAKLQLGMF
jgi:probable FeS assembly SUF system protein SufT